VTVPRTCAGCGLKPVATNGSRYCYDCKKSPRGPRTPPPCRKCGSVTGYYAGGLCRRCHRFAPPVTGSCVDCLGWGVTRATGWLCEGCRGWRRRISRGEGTCVTCGSPRHLNGKGLCRLCRRQAAMVRAGRDGVTAAEASRHGQQLYFIYPGGTFRGFGKPRPAAGPQTVPGRPHPVSYRQLVPGLGGCADRRARWPMVTPPRSPGRLPQAAGPPARPGPCQYRRGTASPPARPQTPRRAGERPRSPPRRIRVAGGVLSRRGGAAATTGPAGGAVTEDPPR
jgi:hypothetical protein